MEQIMTEQDQGSRTAIVTGAAGGIGEALGALWARQGMRVAMTDFPGRGLADAADRARIGAPGADILDVEFDITDPAACDALVARAVDRWGRIDVLGVATATVTAPGPLAELELSEWERVMRVNATGPFLLTRSAIPHLTSPGGSLVYVYSMTAQTGVPGRVVYSASKGALGSFIKSLALELAPQRITVNGVAPMHVEAPINEEALRRTAEAEGITVADARERRDRDIPLRRQATALEVANAMAYLASPEAAYVTGAILDINGGALAR
jgi:NAD(P)-dependent dehydrogenase (short-subunit alcohol dehydrogenase family)